MILFRDRQLQKQLGLITLSGGLVNLGVMLLLSLMIEVTSDDLTAIWLAFTSAFTLVAVIYLAYIAPDAAVRGVVDIFNEFEPIIKQENTDDEDLDTQPATFVTASDGVR
jgi:hypothetical protein